MHALSIWNGGVILISHDERFITTVAREVRLQFMSSFAVDLRPFVALGLWRWYRDEVHGRCTSIQGKYTINHISVSFFHLPFVGFDRKQCEESDTLVYTVILCTNTSTGTPSCTLYIGIVATTECTDLPPFILVAGKLSCLALKYESQKTSSM